LGIISAAGGGILPHGGEECGNKEEKEKQRWTTQQSEHAWLLFVLDQGSSFEDRFEPPEEGEI
jgi:hypothetical protein